MFCSKCKKSLCVNFGPQWFVPCNCLMDAIFAQWNELGTLNLTEASESVVCESRHKEMTFLDRVTLRKKTSKLYFKKNTIKITTIKILLNTFMESLLQTKSLLHSHNTGRIF